MKRETARYGTVEDKVHAVVRKMGEDVSYLFMNWTQANVAFDKIKKPSVVYILPPSGTMKFDWARVKDAPETRIAFLCPTNFDFDGHVNDNVIEQMKRLCYRFIKTLNESELFEVIEGSLNYQVVYDGLDQNVTGIMISPKLEEVDGVVLCNTIYRNSDEVERDEYEEPNPCGCD